MLKFLLKLFIICFAVNIFSISILCASGKYDENEVIAAFVYNISKFIKWDKNKREILINVIGDKQVEKCFGMLDSRKSGNLRIKIYFKKSIRNLKGFDILYIDKSYKNKINLETLKSFVPNYKIFTCSNIKGFADNIGILEFYKERNRIRFKINIAKLKKSGIFLSSKVLELAKIVK